MSHRLQATLDTTHRLVLGKDPHPDRRVLILDEGLPGEVRLEVNSEASACHLLDMLTHLVDSYDPAFVAEWRGLIGVLR